MIIAGKCKLNETALKIRWIRRWISQRADLSVPAERRKRVSRLLLCCVYTHGNKRRTWGWIRGRFPLCGKFFVIEVKPLSFCSKLIGINSKCQGNYLLSMQIVKSGRIALYFAYIAPKNNIFFIYTSSCAASAIAALSTVIFHIFTVLPSGFGVVHGCICCICKCNMGICIFQINNCCKFAMLFLIKTVWTALCIYKWN